MPPSLQVGNTPGVTRSVQEVHLDKHIKLLDSPGVVFVNADSDAAAALRNAIKVEKVADPSEWGGGEGGGRHGAAQRHLGGEGGGPD